MREAKVTLTNSLGLHARAAAKLVRLSARFESKIMISRPEPDRSTNARSILGILELGAKKGTELTVIVDGPDENEAIDAVSDLFDSGFGES